MKMLEDLKRNAENAGPLFQLLLRCNTARPEVSMAVLQVLEGFLGHENDGHGRGQRNGDLGPQLRAAFVDDFLVQGVLRDRTVQMPTYLKNRIAQFLTTAIVLEHDAGTWPDAIGGLLERMQSSLTGCELLLRMCAMLTEEIATQGAKTRSEAEQQRNGRIRDAMRLGDNARLCLFWRRMIETFSSADGDKRQQGASVDTVAIHRNNCVLALECLAAYSSWIDVSLVVDGATLKLLYEQLQSGESTVQMAAADCLAEIVDKGMSVGDKIALASYMNLTSVFRAVEGRGTLDGFFARVCRILDRLGYSLTQQLQMSNGDGEVRERAVEYVSSVLLSHLLAFLSVIARGRGAGDGADDEDAARWVEPLRLLLPLLGAVLDLMRGMRESLREDQRVFLQHLLPVLLVLLEREEGELREVDETDGSRWAVDEDDEFVTLVRPQLLLAFDSVASLQSQDTVGHLNALARGTRASVSSETRVELLSQLCLRLPEALRGHPSFVISINGETRMTPIAELVLWIAAVATENSAARTASTALPLPLQMLVAEVLVRYSSTAFFDSLPEQIAPVLQAVLRVGEQSHFGARASDLLLRLMRNLKGKMASHASMVLGVLQGPFATGLVRTTSLYEAAGLAVAVLHDPHISLGHAVAALLQTSLERALASHVTEDDAALAVELLGAFARGFVMDTCADPGPVRDWFVSFLRLLAGAIDGRRDSPVFLAAGIATVQRVVPLCHAAAIPIICRLSALVTGGCIAHGHATAEEQGRHAWGQLLVQLLPLLAASLFKLRDQFGCAGVMGVVWPAILESTRLVLQGPIHGTDDVLLQASLSRALLSLSLALCNFPAAAECTLHSRTAPGLSLVLDGIVMLLASGRGDAHALSVLTTIPDGAGLMRSVAALATKTISSLEAEFVYGRLLPLSLNCIIPAIVAQLDPTARKHIQSLPTAIHQLMHDMATLLRTVQQHEPQAGLTAARLPAGLVLSGTDVKELKGQLLAFYMSQ